MIIGRKKMKQSKEDILKIVSDIEKNPLIDGSHAFSIYGGITIGEAAELSYEEIGNKAKKKPGISLIEVVLSANRNYTKVVLPNIIRIERNYPNLKTIDQLEKFINEKSERDFFDFWGHNDKKKYQTLINLISSIKYLKKNDESGDDYEVLNKWARDAKVSKLNEDVIGKNKNIGIATFQHLRMAFGIDTVKPDQRVKEIIKLKFGVKSISDVGAIDVVEYVAQVTGKKVFEVDQIFVNYGSGYNKNPNRGRCRKRNSKRV